MSVTRICAACVLRCDMCDAENDECRELDHNRYGAQGLCGRGALLQGLPGGGSQPKAKPTRSSASAGTSFTSASPADTASSLHPDEGLSAAQPAQANTAAVVAEVLTPLQQGNFLLKLPTTVVDAARSRSRSRRWSGGDEHWCRRHRGDNSELHAAG